MLDLDTFLVTVYCLVDEVYRELLAPRKPRRPGRRAELSDSEVLTLLILAQWHPRRSERAFLRYAAAHWRAYFPRLLSQSAFNRRARDLMGALAYLGPTISERTAQLLGKTAAYEVLDAVAVPVERCCRGRRHKLFANEAAPSRGGSDRSWFYGMRLLIAVNPAQQITGFVVGPGNTEERWLADALFRWRCDASAPPPTAVELAPALGSSHRAGAQRLGPTGPLGPRWGAGKPADCPYLGDLGYRGKRWVTHWSQDYASQVLTKADYDRLPNPTRRQKRRWFSGQRQVVETVFDWLEDRFGLLCPRARTAWGVLTRLSAKVAALNLAVHINYLYDRQPFAFLSVID